MRCNFLLEVLKIIPVNQLMLSLICRFNQKSHNEGEKLPLPLPTGTAVPHEILAKLRNIWERFFLNYCNTTIRVTKCQLNLFKSGRIFCGCKRVKAIAWLKDLSKELKSLILFWSWYTGGKVSIFIANIKSFHHGFA